MDAIQVAIDYCLEEGFQYSLGEGRAWVEITHSRGGVRVHQDGTVKATTNYKLKAVLEKKLAQARAQAAEDAEIQGFASLDLYTLIKGRLEDLTDYHLSELIDDIHQLQMDREGEHAADKIGGMLQ